MGVGWTTEVASALVGGGRLGGMSRGDSLKGSDSDCVNGGLQTMTFWIQKLIQVRGELVPREKNKIKKSKNTIR